MSSTNKIICAITIAGVVIAAAIYLKKEPELPSRNSGNYFFDNTATEQQQPRYYYLDKAGKDSYYAIPVK